MPARIDRLHPARPSPLVARAAAGVAAAVALAMAVRLLLAIASPAQLPLVSGLESAPAATPVSVPLADWHLFGLADDTAQALPLADQLRGVAAASDPSRGVAFVADANGQDRGYRIGESLPGGSLLLAVHAEAIDILHQGQRHRVALSSKTTTADVHPGTLPGPALVLSPAAPEVSPVVRDGRTLGLNVSLPDPALRERLGLRPDDLVMTVDGRAADSPGLAETLEQRLVRGDALRLGVRRGGSELTLNLAARNP